MNRRRVARCRYQIGLLLAVIIGFQCDDCSGQFEAAQLRSLSRSGGQTGTTFDLQVKTGTHLEEVSELVFSNPRITAELKTTDPLPFSDHRVPQFGQFTVTVPQDILPGRYEVRTKGRHGLSNPRAFLVSPFPNKIPDAISRDPAKPTPLPRRTLMLSKAASSEVEFFHLEIAKGQRLQVEVFAQRLDSRCIGQLKLFGLDGREIASVRGTDDRDPIMRTPADLPAGHYVLAVHDFLFLGGDEYHYQLLARDIDDASLSTSPADSANTRPPDEDSPDGRLPENWMASSFTHGDEGRLSEPTSEPRDGILQIPFSVTRRFPSAATDTIFDFKANKGDSLSINVLSQRAGEPTDARLRLQRVEVLESGDSRFHDVANADDSQGLSDGAVNLHTTDPVVNVVAPESGDYRLSVRDLDIGNSLRREQFFRVDARASQPGFDLIAYRVYPNKDINQTQAFGSKLFRGGVELVRVFVNRREGFSGPVLLTCEGLPDGISAADTVIAAGQTHTQIALVAAEDADATTSSFRVIGRSEDGSLKSVASAATIQWAKGGGRDFIRTRLCAALMASVSDQDIAPVSIAPAAESALESKPESSIKLPFKVTRREGGDSPCTIRARDLPSGVTAADLTIPADKSEGEMELKIQKSAKPGSYSLWFQVETKIKYKPNPQAAERSQAYRDQLQKLHDAPANADAANADHLAAIKDAIVEADKRLEASKNAAKPKQLTVFLPTPNATLRVLNP